MAQSFGTLTAVGVESTGAYAAGLVRHLTSQDIHVLKVNQPHPHTRRRRGKSDAIDAEMAARRVLSGEGTVIPKATSGVVESIRQLRLTRQSAVKAHSAALVQLSQLIVTTPAELREYLSQRKTIRARATLCARLRPDTARTHEPLQAAKFALRSIARRITRSRRRDRGARPAPRTPRRRRSTTYNQAVRGLHHPHRAAPRDRRRKHPAPRSEGSFAALCGASPIPVSSGRTDRHRLNHGGDRDANRALHMITVCRLRYAPEPAPTPNAAHKKKRPNARSSAASSATSPARSTTPSNKTSLSETKLDIYRNVRGNSTEP